MFDIRFVPHHAPSRWRQAWGDGEPDPGPCGTVRREGGAGPGWEGERLSVYLCKGAWARQVRDMQGQDRARRTSIHLGDLATDDASTSVMYARGTAGRPSRTRPGLRRRAVSGPRGLRSDHMGGVTVTAK
jgi:hypothetical protein